MVRKKDTRIPTHNAPMYGREYWRQNEKQSMLMPSVTEFHRHKLNADCRHVDIADGPSIRTRKRGREGERERSDGEAFEVEYYYYHS